MSVDLSPVDLLPPHLFGRQCRVNIIMFCWCNVWPTIYGEHNIWPTQCMTDKMVGQDNVCLDNVWLTQGLADTRFGRHKVWLTQCLADTVLGLVQCLSDKVFDWSTKWPTSCLAKRPTQYWPAHHVWPIQCLTKRPTHHWPTLCLIGRHYV
jgi:hypothetical protein